MLGLAGERRGDGTGQRRHPEAAVHAGMVGRMSGKVNQPTEPLWPRLSDGRSWDEYQKAVMAPAASPSAWRSLGMDANVGAAAGMSWRR